MFIILSEMIQHDHQHIPYVSHIHLSNAVGVCLLGCHQVVTLFKWVDNVRDKHYIWFFQFISYMAFIFTALDSTSVALGHTSVTLGTLEMIHANRPSISSLKHHGSFLLKMKILKSENTFLDDISVLHTGCHTSSTWSNEYSAQCRLYSKVFQTSKRWRMIIQIALRYLVGDHLAVCLPAKPMVSEWGNIRVQSSFATLYNVQASYDRPSPPDLVCIRTLGRIPMYALNFQLVRLRHVC